MELKCIVKNGKKLLAASQFREAYATLKEAIDGGEEDYLLFCLFALAASNDNKIEEAVEMYGKAIDLDGKSLIAWQGLNKMYSTGIVAVDARAVETVDILLKESDESKKDALMRDRRRYMMELGNWKCLTIEDLENEREAIPKILSSIISEEKELSADDTNTCSKCFSILGNDLNSATALQKAMFMYKTGGYSSWSSIVYENRVDRENKWIDDKRRLAMAIQYMMEGKIDKEWREIIGDDPHDPLFRCLFAIDDGDGIFASEIMESMVSLDTPFSIVSLPFLIRDEEYEEARTRIKSLKTKFLHDSEVLECLGGWEAESLLRSGDIIAAVHCIPLPRPQFAMVEARILMENGKEMDNSLIGSLNPIDKLRLDVREMLKEGRKEEAREKCKEFNGDEWEDVLLEGECSSSSNAINLFVRAAKLNPRCSRAFYLLATVLRGKNRRKAVSLAERAASIRPSNEEYARLVDELMSENGEEDGKRLECLRRFVRAISPIPEWARIAISRLLLHSNGVNEALSYLQEGIGETSSSIRWALLGEAYSLRGQLSSSINAFEESLKREHNLHIVVSMLGVSLRLGDFPRTINLCNGWLREARETSAITPILITLSKSILAICGDDMRSHLPSLFIHITELSSSAAPSSILYKLFADSLFLLSKTSVSLFSLVSTPPQWNITDRISCLKVSTHFYSKCVEMSRDEGWYWADFALSLYLLWQMEGDVQVLERARKCLVLAIKLSGEKKKTSRSKLWTYLAMIEEARGEGSLRVRHCLSRSLQLNGRNDEAWLRLGVLFMKEGELRAACECIEKCTKWNPLRSEAWSVWGEMSGGTEGEDMMRHSLSLYPTIWAVNRYTQMVCERLVKGEKWSASRILIDMKRVLELRYYSSLSSREDRLRMGVLAELCGCFEEASQIYQSVGECVHRERNDLKLSCLPSSSTNSPNAKELFPIHKLCGETTQRLRELVEGCECVLDPCEKEEMMGEEGEEEGKERVVKRVYPSLEGHSIPLLVSAIILFHHDADDNFISALHDLSPRDELIDYFPTVIPEGTDNGIRFISKDGEEPYRIHNEVSRDLLAILKRRQVQINA